MCPRQVYISPNFQLLGYPAVLNFKTWSVRLQTSGEENISNVYLDSWHPFMGKVYEYQWGSTKFGLFKHLSNPQNSPCMDQLDGQNFSCPKSGSFLHGLFELRTAPCESKTGSEEYVLYDVPLCLPNHLYFSWIASRVLSLFSNRDFWSRNTAASFR